jgi:hypothetical protein
MRGNLVFQLDRRSRVFENVALRRIFGHKRVEETGE